MKRLPDEGTGLYSLYFSPSASKSARSFSRSLARLLATNCSRPTKKTGYPASSPASRPHQVASFETPEIELIKSILTGE